MSTATNKQTSVQLLDAQALGVHRAGRTGVKATTDGQFAVVSLTPQRDGTLRLIKLFSDALHARRYNFAIHGDKL